MSTTVILPRMMQVGENAIEHTPEILQTLQCSRPLIITDKTMIQLGYLDTLQTILQSHNIQADVYSDTVPEPTESSLQGGIQMVQTGRYDVLIALGGGSPIDSAKAIAILGVFGGRMKQYRFPRQVNEQGLPLLAIPTTAGTGSEATRVTVITDDEANEKLMCMGMGFMPTAAIVDYKLTMTVPARTTADTGIDAFTHALEAYVSRKANMYSDIQALAAMRLIAPNLRTACQQGNNQAAREAMMLGASLAGSAFSNSALALVHGMSRPIGAFFHVPHGLSNAMLLPTVTAYSIEGAPQRYAECARAAGFAETQDSDAVANQKLLAELTAINRDLDVPSLAEFGVKRADFDAVVDTMASQALASGSPNNNPRIPEHAEIVSLYHQLW